MGLKIIYLIYLYKLSKIRRCYGIDHVYTFNNRLIYSNIRNGKVVNIHFVYYQLVRPRSIILLHVIKHYKNKNNNAANIIMKNIEHFKSGILYETQFIYYVI